MRVLIVDDEQELLELLSLSLKDTFVVDTASTVEEAKSYMDSFCYQAAVFDRTFFGVDKAQELITYAKSKNPSCGVMALSAMSSVDDKVEGLEFGADDYLEKPFSVKELRARVGALCRRFSQNKIVLEGVEIDMESKNVSKDGLQIPLSKKESSLLFYLLFRRGRVVSREEIMDAIYENPQDVTQNAIDELVARVRKKLSSTLIKTIKTRGYTIEG